MMTGGGFGPMSFPGQAASLPAMNMSNGMRPGFPSGR